MTRRYRSLLAILGTLLLAPLAEAQGPKPGYILEKAIDIPVVTEKLPEENGPAALQALLLGHGIEESLDRLKELCGSAKGTSIDELERVAGQYGLAAEQVMLPVEHILGPAPFGLLPAIALTEDAAGEQRFLVLWRVAGSWIQVLDTARGRRWMQKWDLLRHLLRYEVNRPAEEWRSHADSVFRFKLGWRLERLGVTREQRQLLVTEAEADPSWRGLAALDAAARWARVTNQEPEAIVRAFQCERSEVPTCRADERVPEKYWTALPLADGGGDRLRVRGTVLITVKKGAR